MGADLSKRLGRLRDNLRELKDARQGPCGFGVVSIDGASGVRLPHQTAWQFLDLQELRLSVPTPYNLDRYEDQIRLRPDPWYDPAPGGTSALRWWGDRERVPRFREWAERASAVCHSDPDVDLGVAFEPGYHGLLSAFVQLAKAGTSGLSAVVHSRPLLATSSVPESKRALLPPPLRPPGHPAVIRFDDVLAPAEQFAEAVIDWMLRGPCRGPRLVVDVESESVTFDGKTHFPGDVFVHILHELVKARGIPISRRDMQENRVLKDQERLDRDIKALKAKLKIDIRTMPHKGYYLPKEYWA